MKANNERKQNIYSFVLEKLALKQEGFNWDFKREWYSEKQKSDLLHDIICMSNQIAHTDSYLIIGIDEENDFSVCGVEKDENRKNTQSIVTFLRDKHFASGIRPIVYVETIQIESHLVDVIVVCDSINTPFYLTEKFQEVQQDHIYTRIQDTNTDITKSADPDIVEKLWKKRFGIDRTALQRAFLYLQHPDDWADIENEMGYYYKYAPEFTIIRDTLPQSGYEYYHCTQTDPIPCWYEITIRYHQTTIYSAEGISMDGGRYFTVTPQYDLLYVASPPVKFSYYIEGSENFILFAFYNSKSLSKDDRLSQRKFLEIVPIFCSINEKKSFWEYAEKHFSTKRKPLDHRFLPPFIEHIGNDQNLNIIKDEYLDALACMWLLADYRKQLSKGIDIN